MYKEILASFMEEFSFPPEARETFLSCYDTLCALPQTRENLEQIVLAYQNNLHFDNESVCAKIRETADLCRVHPETVFMLVAILYADVAKEYYRTFGISREVYHTTMMDLSYKLTECKLLYNVWGTFVFTWFCGFFHLRRFGFSRLQFELTRFGRKLELDGVCLFPGDYVLGVHIPRTGTRLDHGEVLRSYAEAAAFFAPVLRRDVTPFVCHSWLLNPQNKAFLGPDSNISRFMSDFTLLESGLDENLGEIWRLFDKEYDGDLSRLPADTSLRRAYLDHFRAGGRFGWGYGIFLRRPNPSPDSSRRAKEVI